MSPPDEPAPVCCPRCGRATDSLKCYDFPVVVFLIVYIAWSRETVIACAACMRGEIAKRAALALFLANIAAPFVWIWHLVLLIDTASTGHSDPRLALAHERPPDSPEFSPAPPAPATTRRQKVVLGFVLVLLTAGVLWIVFAARNDRHAVQAPHPDDWRPIDVLPPEALASLTTTRPIQNPRLKVAALLLFLKEADDARRVTAIQALGEMGPEAAEAVPSLIPLLNEPNPRIAAAARAALTKIDPARALDAPP